MAGWHRGSPGTGRHGRMPLTGSGGGNQVAAGPGWAQRGHHTAAAGRSRQPPIRAARFSGISRLCRAAVRTVPAGRGTSTPSQTCWEEWTHAASSHQPPPPPPHRGASAGGRKDTRGEDQDKLCRPGLRGLASAALRVAARSAILVRPAYLPALDPPLVRCCAPRRGQMPITQGEERGGRGGSACRRGRFDRARYWPPAGRWCRPGGL